MSETALSAAIRETCNLQPGVRVRRNNVGKLRDEHGRWVTYGQGIGSPDLMGEVTVRMLLGGHWQHDIDWCGPHDARDIARAFCLEVKLPKKKPEPDQVAWMQEARKRGVFCAVVRSVDEALAAIERCRKGEVE